jgi:hypothetical protein
MMKCSLQLNRRSPAVAALGRVVARSASPPTLFIGRFR